MMKCVCLCFQELLLLTIITLWLPLEVNTLNSMTSTGKTKHNMGTEATT